MTRKACLLAFVLLAAGAAAGCAASGRFFTAAAEAAEPEYYWTRQKIAEGAQWSAETADQKAWLLASRAEPVESVLPSAVAHAIPKAHTRRLDSLKEIQPSAFGRYAVLKSGNGEWNREVFYAVSEGESVTLEVEGPKKIMALSMLSINRDEALDNARKHIYTFEDESGATREAPAYSCRRKDILFLHTESESASTPHVSVIEVPDGKHTYIFRFRYSDGGDILLKFFEAVYP